MQSSELFLNNKIKTEFPVFFACKSLLFIIYFQTENFINFVLSKKTLTLTHREICKK